MSDYSFLRSGTAGYVQSAPAVDVEFIRKISSIMKVLLRQAIKTADRFVKACGRTSITAADTRLALKYEAHEFFRMPDLETEFARAMAEEQQHTYETSDESESTDGDGDGTTDAVEAEEYTTAFVGPPADRAFHELVLRYDREWELWEPDDHAQQLIKRAVDNIPLQPSSSDEDEGEEGEEGEEDGDGEEDEGEEDEGEEDEGT